MMKQTTATTLFLAMLLVSGCGELSEKAKEQTEKIVKEEVQKAREEAKKKISEAREEADRKVREAREEADKKVREVTDKIEQYEGEGKKWLRYVKLALYVLGAITAIKLLGKPVARVSVCIVLKHWSPSPRQVLPIQAKEEDSDETRLEPA